MKKTDQHMHPFAYDSLKDLCDGLHSETLRLCKMIVTIDDVTSFIISLNWKVTFN